MGKASIVNCVITLEGLAAYLASRVIYIYICMKLLCCGSEGSGFVKSPRQLLNVVVGFERPDLEERPLGWPDVGQGTVDQLSAKSKSKQFFR